MDYNEVRRERKDEAGEMKQTIILWVSAIIIVFIVSFAQHIRSNEFPISGTIDLGSGNVSYDFDRVVHTKNGYRVIIASDIKDMSGKLYWRTAEDSVWNSTALIDSGNIFYAMIPAQEPRTKIFCRVKLLYNGKNYLLPVKRAADITFYKSIPDEIFQFYYITLFAGLILGVRTALEAFNEKSKMKKLSVFTAISFFSFTFVFSTVKKGVEIGAVGGGGVPLSDIFDLRGILLFAVSVITMILIVNSRRRRIWAVAGAVVLLLVFLGA